MYQPHNHDVTTMLRPKSTSQSTVAPVKVIAPQTSQAFWEVGITSTFNWFFLAIVLLI